ncbi:MAG: hypothetical protein C3F13_09965 [Anaerolineales bacterium]|nr:hypothetical protein [Anaerolineae bacterium]PWB53150.1 MAG: hypothetical protein C3F13_09965 [Anaerolineales bacterium]
MGLDNYASRCKDNILLTEADRQAFSDADINLWGGLFSGEDGSFRGEMYDLLLLDVTGVSPLQAWIPPEIVQEMYRALLYCAPATILYMYQQDFVDRDEEYRGPSLEELTTNILELRKFFRVCTERGLGLIGDF